MKCPKCSQELQARTREAVLVDFCENCKGVWVGPMQIKLMIQNHRAELSPAQIEEVLKNARPEEIPADEQALVTNCPVCTKRMHAVNYNYSSGVIVNVCSQGHGIWFDQGELEQVEIFMEYWDQQKSEHQAEYRSLMKSASLEETQIIHQMDDAILKDISPTGFLPFVFRAFHSTKSS